jgi:hypothetical protein
VVSGSEGASRSSRPSTTTKAALSATAPHVGAGTVVVSSTGGGFAPNVPAASGTKPPPQQQSGLSPGSIPLIVTNLCQEEIYPAINTQYSTGPESNGFQLDPGQSRNLSVAHDWQGRVWARTNCTFTNERTSQKACGTGDCAGALNCQVAVCHRPSKFLCEC